MKTLLVAAVLLISASVTAAWAIPLHRVVVGTFRQEVAHSFNTARGLPSDDVTDVRFNPAGQLLITAGGAHYRREGEAWVSEKGMPDPPRAVASAAFIPRGWSIDSSRRIAVATDEGVFTGRAEDSWEDLKKLVVRDGVGRIWADSDVRGVTFDPGGNLWLATAAGVVSGQGDGWRFYEGKDGLPLSDFTSAAAGRDGSVWFGTGRGLVVFRNGEWHYRQGRRWLPDDQVRAVAPDPDGGAWIATAGGLGRIELRPMTLTDKARFYESELVKIRRTSFGYTSEVRLARPGDRSTIQYTDSDNDGLWTAMYGAAQCFAFAATGDPQARDRARQAFEALRFLQKVPEGSTHPPPRGYVARTILPADGPDPNQGGLAADLEFQRTRDRLWKIYEPRWPLSADGAWYWKSDTSSDELDGHYFFYPLYYDLVADTEPERERVREVVRDLTDHLLTHGFNLVDHDGRPTRWGRYSPEELNHSPWWWSERGLKSLSMLSYLAVAEHVTGESRYAEASRSLRETHAFHTNAMIAKVQMGPGSGNQSDDEMAVMCFYNLIKYTRDPELAAQMKYAFYQYWVLLQPEMNPFFNFAYAAHGLGASYTNPWGTHAIDPWPGWLEDSVRTLTGFPLDRVNWPLENGHRQDVVFLPRQQALEPYEAESPGQRSRGNLVNGKVLPVENRHFNHWNTDPWALDYPGDGRTLGSGTVFLLPYYMGLHYGFIAGD